MVRKIKIYKNQGYIMNENDRDIIQHIEEALNIKLEQLDTIAWNSRGYLLNEEGQVVGLALYDCGIDDLRSIIFLLRDLEYLSILNLVENRISNLSPLNQLRHLIILYLRYNQTGDLSPLLVKLRKSIHWV